MEGPERLDPEGAADACDAVLHDHLVDRCRLRDQLLGVAGPGFQHRHHLTPVLVRGAAISGCAVVAVFGAGLGLLTARRDDFVSLLRV